MNWRRYFLNFKWRVKSALTRKGDDYMIKLLISTNIGVYMSWQLLSPRFMWQNFMMNEMNTVWDKKYYTIFTSAFSHQGLLHLGMNMIGLWFFGRPVESMIGSARLLTLYLSGALGGYVALWRKYKRKYMAPLPNALGASAAISAIFVYFVCSNPWQPVLFFFVPMPAILAGLILFALGARGGDHYVSHSGHAGGGVAGGLFYLLARR